MTLVYIIIKIYVVLFSSVSQTIATKDENMSEQHGDNYCCLEPEEDGKN